jgi:hypothetical protein
MSIAQFEITLFLLAAGGIVNKLPSVLTQL